MIEIEAAVLATAIERDLVEFGAQSDRGVA